VEQGFIEFLASRLKKTLFVRIAVGHGIGCESIGGVLVLPKRRINTNGSFNDFAKIVNSFEGAAVKDQKPFERFFSGLLAVINGSIQMSIRQPAYLLGGVQIVVRLDQPSAAKFGCRPSHRAFDPVQKSYAKGRRPNAGSGQIQTGC